MNVKQTITQSLEKVLKEIGIEEVRVELSVPTDLTHGDYTTNIALIAFARVKGKGERVKFTNPVQLAEDIASRLTLNALPFIEKVEALAPGFINFYLSKEYLVKHLSSSFWEATTSPESVRQSQDRSDPGQARMTITAGLYKDQKIIVEFTDPNPFKEFHIGHLYSNVVGESLSRLLESQGAHVWRVTYQGDVGLHVAKAIYGLFNIVISNEVRDLLKEKDFSQELEMTSNEMLKQVQHDALQKKVQLLGKAYAFGAKAYEEDPKAKEEIHAINKKVYDKSDPEINELYKKGRQWSLEYFETIYTRLGTTFVNNYFESEAGPIGIALVKEHIKDKVFKESEGAIIFEGEKYGLHNRVFINSLGLPTYEAKDMGLPSRKYKDFPYDLSIIITAHEQSDYFKVVLKALSLISPELAAKTMHIAHGMVRLPSGKMSSRTGNVLTGEWLLDETKKHIGNTYKEIDPETAEKVAVAAVKYALLKSGIGRDTIFDISESISFEGNSGPYLQYTYARTRSVLAKVKTQKSKLKSSMQNSKVDDVLHITNYMLQDEEKTLARLLYRFSDVVDESASKMAPNTLCTYLFNLAQEFNFFYQKCPILGSEKEALRLGLTKATGTVLEQGLYLLGIQAPERM